MNIELRINKKGKPYLRLEADSLDLTNKVEDELLMFFIREAKEKELILYWQKNDCSDTSAEVRIKEEIK